jgi:hypothetical protein
MEQKSLLELRAPPSKRVRGGSCGSGSPPSSMSNDVQNIGFLKQWIEKVKCVTNENILENLYFHQNRSKVQL